MIADVSRELIVGEDSATVRLKLPFVQRGDISLKKIGLELVVRVDGSKRTIMLPPALAAFQPSEATFADGALQVILDAPDRSAHDDERTE